jgi:hypothetical protein
MNEKRKQTHLSFRKLKIKKPEAKASGFSMFRPLMS